jgi:protein TonB
MILAALDRGAPAGPEQAVPAEFALAAGKKASVSRGNRMKPVYIAAAVSLAIHILLLGSFVSGLIQGAPPPPEPAKEELGDEKGLPENVNVSLITEADLKSLSSDPFKSMPSQPQPPPEPQQSNEPPQDAASPQQEKAVKEEQKAKQPIRAIEDPNGFAARAAEAFTSSMTRAFAEIERKQSAPQTRSTQPAMPPNMHFFRPAATHSGKSDEYARQVAWALAATKPQGNGTYGSTIVAFIVGPDGHLQDLRMLKSSGDNWLDTGALMAVRQARLPVPPDAMPVGDRTFHVEYISRF